MSAAARLSGLFVVPAAAEEAAVAAAEAEPTAPGGAEARQRPRTSRKPRPGRPTLSAVATPLPAATLPETAHTLRVVPAVVDPPPPAPATLGPTCTESAPAATDALELDSFALRHLGLQVCVLGGDRSGLVLARALAAKLARTPGARHAVLCLAPGWEGVAAPPFGPTAPAARRVARGLVAEGLAASVRGRVVELALAEATEDATRGIAAVQRHAGDAPTVTLLPARAAAYDGLVAGQDLLLAVVAADAPPSLATLALGELGLVAPGAVVRAVPLPSRLGAPARRAAVRKALEALR